MKTALVIGVDGQDGQLLYDYLLKRGYQLLGLGRGSTRTSGIDWDTPVNICDTEEVASLMEAVKPHEVYHLAAFHHSSEDAPLGTVELFRQSFDVNDLSLTNFLEALKNHVPAGRLFYAASSHIFADTESTVQDENTPMMPSSIYGISKACGLLICRYYRNQFGIFSSAGILYNHESELRDEKFISKKIIKGALKIKHGQQKKLMVGDLNAEVDWGYAPDYVDAMVKILNVERPGEFIIASGEKHSVLDFVKIVFDYLKLDWQNCVEENEAQITKKQVSLMGNSKKLRELTGWKPAIPFKEMVRLMLLKEGIPL